jgi:ubiquinone/menaquinone biosynthesis C-methylase UbiE
MLGDATSIPFVDKGFHMITDVGTFQHLTKDLWPAYLSEITRVVKDHGYYINVSLSKQTRRFYGWNPQTDNENTYTKFGVHYHFFENEDIQEIFGDHFIILNQKVEHYSSQSDPADDVALVFTLMQKKNAS